MRRFSVVFQQLLREWPPGYGGVERVAHELGNVWGAVVFSLDVQGQADLSKDALHVRYPRKRLRSIRIVGRLFLPLPCRSLFSLIASSEPLHGHLPSPSVLLLLILARLLRPRRILRPLALFLETTPGLTGRLYGLYQLVSLRVLTFLTGVVTTSPVLSAELRNNGCSPLMLLCCPVA